MSSPPKNAAANSAIALALACAALGSAVGWMTSWLLSAPVADEQMSATTGMLVGGAIGFVAGLYLLRGLSVRARWWSAFVAVLLAVGTIWSLGLAGN